MNPNLCQRELALGIYRHWCAACTKPTADMREAQEDAMA